MKCDVVLVGVGGHGVLSLANFLGRTAIEEGLVVKQTEVHGMAQRGAAVWAHLRLADHPIHSGLIPIGTADLLLSMEPVETFRYLDYLGPEGIVVASVDPVLNIEDYPPIATVREALARIPRAHLVEVEALARRAGSPKTANVVLAGAAAPYLPISPEALERHLRVAFEAKGTKVVEANLRALALGREAGRCAVS